jgi:TolB-like protein/DNA-binding winged helix-turn-helix (wHTH) protein/Tfp pilus assembly protein PilF
MTFDSVGYGAPIVGSDYQLGEWVVRPQRDCIERGGETVHLKPKAMAVLACLLRADGGVVERTELFDSVWPGAVVSDSTLTQCVVELRHAFGDSARYPRVIETVPKVGFRLIPPVRALDGEDAGDTTGAALPRERPPPLPLRWWVLAASAMSLLALLGWYLLLQHEQLPIREDEAVKTLLVLPFHDLSRDQDQGWIARGLSQELATRLARLGGLRVNASYSSSWFNYANVEVGKAVDSLGIAYVLEGSVLREKARFRVMVQLLEAPSGVTLWSKVFDRPVEDMLAMQQEIAESVANALSIKLGVGSLGTIAGGTSSVEAFERLVEARGLLLEFSAESVLQGIESLKQAIEIDPEYAEAWMWLVVFYTLAPLAVDDSMGFDWAALAKQALDQAAALQPDLPGLVGLRVNQLTHSRRWAEVEETMGQAPSPGDSSDAQLPFYYGIFLAHVGRAGEALAMLKRARLLDPFAAHIARMLGHAYLISGHMEEALAEYERAWHMERVIYRLCASEGLLVALSMGNREATDRWLDRALRHVEGEELKLLQAMAQRLDDRSAALSWLESAFAETGWDHTQHLIAIWAAYHGDPRLALDALSSAPEDWYFWLPLMAEVRRAPEFRSIVRELGLVDYWQAYTWADFCRPLGEAGFECR